MITEIILTIWIIILLFWIYLLYRNQVVYHHRKAILDAIWEAYRHGDDYEELSHVFDTIRYEDMLFKFWIPLDSFWPSDFLERLEEK